MQHRCYQSPGAWSPSPSSHLPQDMRLLAFSLGAPSVSRASFGAWGRQRGQNIVHGWNCGFPRSPKTHGMLGPGH